MGEWMDGCMSVFSVCMSVFLYACIHAYNVCIYIYKYTYVCVAARTAQGGGGSFKDRTPIGQVRCCESWMAEQIL